MPRTHNKITCSDGSQIDCQCEACWAEDLRDKYPDILNKYLTNEIAEVWVSYSEQSCASWLDDDRITVFQVFSQANKWLEQGKPEDFIWRTGTEFK